MSQRRIGIWLSWLVAPAFIPLLSGCGDQIIVYHPAGPVARQELHLINLSIVLVLVIFIPVMIMMWLIVRKYRDKPGNTAPYEPEWSESARLEVVWWGVPIVIVAILGIVTVRTTYALTRPPESVTATPLTIQVTSLNWKWLFQYPGENIATVNYCEIPTNRPVQFVLTAKAPMNSFWVPQLGGQEYAMPGMAMRLWLQADKPGTYFGTGANFSGVGFAHMTFHVKATSQQGFANWVKQVKATAPPLTMVGYHSLVQQQTVMSQAEYSSYPLGTFYDTVMEDGGMYYGRHDQAILQGQHQD